MIRLGKQEKNGPLFRGEWKPNWLTETFSPKGRVNATPIGNPRIITTKTIWDGVEYSDIRERAPKGANAYLIERDTTLRSSCTDKPIRESRLVSYYKIEP